MKWIENNANNKKRTKWKEIITIKQKYRVNKKKKEEKITYKINVLIYYVYAPPWGFAAIPLDFYYSQILLYDLITSN